MCLPRDGCGENVRFWEEASLKRTTGSEARNRGVAPKPSRTAPRALYIEYPCRLWGLIPLTQKALRESNFILPALEPRLQLV